MTLRPYLAPYGISLALIALAYAVARSGGGIAGLWILLAAFIAFPLIVGGFEFDRIPRGRWWIAPLIAAAISIATLIGLLFYAFSRI